MDTPSSVARGSFGRRRLLAGAGAAALATTGGVAMGAGTAAAQGDDITQLRRAKPVPKPIPGGVDAPPEGFIHWFLPGPPDKMTPVLQIPGGGFDVEPSTMTDFAGFTAFSILAGEATGSDGQSYLVEFDVRVMQGKYMAEDGSEQGGTFAFM